MVVTLRERTSTSHRPWGATSSKITQECGDRRRKARREREGGSIKEAGESTGVRSPFAGARNRTGDQQPSRPSDGRSCDGGVDNESDGRSKGTLGWTVEGSRRGKDRREGGEERHEESLLGSKGRPRRRRYGAWSGQAAIGWLRLRARVCRTHNGTQNERLEVGAVQRRWAGEANTQGFLWGDGDSGKV